VISNDPKNSSEKNKTKFCEFLILNNIMTELKKTPNDLEILPPRYFREMKNTEERNNMLDACYKYAFGNADFDEDKEPNPFHFPGLSETDENKNNNN